MTGPDVLQSDFEQNLFGGAQTQERHERFLGINERDEALVATTAFIGPIATMFAMHERPFSPMETARPVATAAEVAQTVEFLPDIEAQAAEWRAGAERDMSTAAIMFAWERADIDPAVGRSGYELAA
jgi:hypothetical protein